MHDTWAWVLAHMVLAVVPIAAVLVALRAFREVEDSLARDRYLNEQEIFLHGQVARTPRRCASPRSATRWGRSTS
jgi:hypothetical protein